jgi:hypothetical protein
MLQNPSGQDSERQELLAAARTAYEMVNSDFHISENDCSLRDMVAEAIIQCAIEGLSEVTAIRLRAHHLLKARFH